MSETIGPDANLSQSVDYHNQVPEDDDAVELSINIIDRLRVEVTDGKVVVGEAIRFGFREDWYVQNKSDHDGKMYPIGRVYVQNVSEVQSRKMILAMLKAFYNID